jgi:hypothetical protein
MTMNAVSAVTAVAKARHNRSRLNAKPATLGTDDGRPRGLRVRATITGLRTGIAQGVPRQTVIIQARKAGATYVVSPMTNLHAAAVEKEFG